MSPITRWRVRRRGEPVFAFIDPDVSDEPFLVDRVRLTAMGALLDALAQMAGSSWDTTLYVTDPFGDTYSLASFDSTYEETAWLDRARRLAVDGGAPAIADHSHARRFRSRYGSGD